jgi:hypothetical protein
MVVSLESLIENFSTRSFIFENTNQRISNFWILYRYYIWKINFHFFYVSNNENFSVRSKVGLRYDIWWGKFARTKYSSGMTKPVTAENSGHSYNQLIVNLLNTPILRRMDSSDHFPSMHTPTKCYISARPYSTYLIQIIAYFLNLKNWWCFKLTWIFTRLLQSKEKLFLMLFLRWKMREGEKKIGK